MTAGVERRRRVPRAERERQMLAVAEEVFADRGYQATSMDDIAERVGVSKPMIYEYFGSKEGLLVACIRDVRTQLTAAVTDAVVGAADPEQALRRGLVAFFEFTANRRRAWDLMLRSEAAVAGRAALAEIEEARREQTAIDMVLLRGFYPDAPERDIEAAAEIVVGACERLSLWFVARDDVTAEEAAEHLMRLVWFGMKPRDLPRPDQS